MAAVPGPDAEFAGQPRALYGAPSGWETIPFFHAVYHPYAVFYGNYSSLTMPPYDDLWPAEFAPKEPLKLLDPKFNRQFCLEQARSFVWGQQPAIANFLPVELTERAGEVGLRDADSAGAQPGGEVSSPWDIPAARRSYAGRPPRWTFRVSGSMAGGRVA